MQHIGIRQAREQLPSLINRAEAGEVVIITRQGEPVAQLVAVPKACKSLPSLAAFRAGMGKAGTPSVDLLREDRDKR